MYKYTKLEYEWYLISVYKEQDQQNQLDQQNDQQNDEKLEKRQSGGSYYLYGPVTNPMSCKECYNGPLLETTHTVTGIIWNSK